MGAPTPRLQPDTCYSNEPAWVTYDVLGVLTDTWAVLIDLADTAFKHKHHGSITLDTTWIQIDRNNTGEGSVVVGVITAITATQATVKGLHRLNFIQEATQGHLETGRRYDGFPMRLDQTGGVLDHGVTSLEYTTTQLNTATAAASPLGAASVVPAVGDVVVGCLWSNGTYDTEIHATYFGEPT